MSRENVDAVHRANDDFNRRDLDGFLALMNPAIEFMPYERALQGGDPYRGHSGVREWWQDSFAVIPNLRVETRDVRGAGNRTFTGGLLRGEGAGSGAAFERPLWQAARWQDGKATWWRAYENEAEALAAAGLSE